MPAGSPPFLIAHIYDDALMTTHADSLSSRDLNRLCRLIYEQSGITLGAEKKIMLEGRLKWRITTLHLSSYKEYCDYLFAGNGHDVEEMVHLIDAVSTNKTDFFREKTHFDFLVARALPELTAGDRNAREVMIWSAGCSTGEEAYTIAILVHQSGLFFPRRKLTPSPPLSTFPEGPGTEEQPLWDIRIYGSDISRRCVAAARRGVYTDSSFRATPEELRRSCFVPDADGWRVSESIRQLCRFGKMNLLDEERSRALGKADAIFCRNVLIYFDARARKTAIEVLYDRLNPGGVLLLGHSESLLNVSTAFELLHLKDDLVYRKPLSARGPAKTTDDPT